MSSNITTEPTSVDLGEGWRLLEIGEPLKSGDGFLDPDHKIWIDYECRPDLFRGDKEFAHSWPWRRRIESPSVSVETKTEDLGKQKPSSEMAAVLQNALKECPWPADVWPHSLEDAGEIMRHVLGKAETTAISGTLMRHGWQCAEKKIQVILSEHGGDSLAAGASSKSLTEPASGKFKMSIFDELLRESQNAATYLINSSDIGTAKYELGIRLQLAIERAAK